MTQTVLTFERLDVDCFQQAWDEVIKRHVTFRTAFVGMADGNAHQVVYKSVNLPWYIEDISGLDELEQSKHVDALRLADKVQGFGESQAPLMRMSLLKLTKRSS